MSLPLKPPGGQGPAMNLPGREIFHVMEIVVARARGKNRSFARIIVMRIKPIGSGNSEM